MHAEILRESPVGHWNRLSVGLMDHFDVSPIPKSCGEGKLAMLYIYAKFAVLALRKATLHIFAISAVEVYSSTDESSSSSSPSHSLIGENYEAEPRNTIPPRLSALNYSTTSCHLSPTGSLL